MLKINIVNNYNDATKEYKKIIKKVVKGVVKEEKYRKHSSVNFILINNEEIHEINLKYRNIDRPTDVISFEDNEDDTLGDIFISIDKVVEQAKEYGHSFTRELGFLVCHGTLHCLGYDHIVDSDRLIMEEKQKKILDNVGLKR